MKDEFEESVAIRVDPGRQEVMQIHRHRENIIALLFDISAAAAMALPTLLPKIHPKS